jgi:hypothetical protein
MLEMKYFFLIWIVVLILFTFYCLYRLSKMTPPPTTIPLITKLPDIAKFDNTSQPTNQNLVSYINDLEANDKITSLPGCEKIYDDNIAVRALGYNSCASANADYYNRNLDINKTYGNAKSLAQLCPISTKSDTYMNCMQQLMAKFSTNADMIDKVSTDMTTVLNKRLNDRSDLLNNIEISIKPYLFSKDQVDFTNNMTLGEPINPTPDQVLNNVNMYYQIKYGASKSVFSNIPKENIPKENFITTSLDIYNVDPYIESMFFGIYTPVKGQYLAFNNLTITLNYDTQPTQSMAQSATPQQTKRISIIIIDNNTGTRIVYAVSNIDFYMQYKNVIIVDLLSQTINSKQPSDTLALQQLLATLGVNVPMRIIITVEEFTSTENITRKTYKILNADNMNTIMVLEKQ